MQDQETVPHLPYDVENEQALLGALLVNNKLIDQAAADLEPEHFYDPLHGRIFEMVCYMAGEGGVNPVILHGLMKHDPGLIEMGGIKYLADLAGASSMAPSIRDGVKLLKELHSRRALIAIGESMIAAAGEGPRESPAIIIASGATERLLRIGSDTVRPVISAFNAAMESIREAESIARGDPIPMVKTGFPKVDGEIGGLRGGDFIPVPGKSGMGKSALMVALSLNTALAGVPTIVFSMEMMRRQWVDRMVCAIDFMKNGYGDYGTGRARALWYSRVRNGKLSNDEFQRYMLAARSLEGLPLEINDEDGLTLGQIQARARAFKAKHPGKLGIVIGDYIQIIDPGDVPRGQSREQTVNGFARGLKNLAKRLDWPVVFGSQMNENDQARGKDERRPQGGDVRESKGIFNEADLMLSPWRPAYFVENRRPEGGHDTPEMAAWRGDLSAVRNTLEILGLKNRHGRRFNISMFTEIGSNAICDEEPIGGVSQAQADLLEGR